MCAEFAPAAFILLVLPYLKTFVKTTRTRISTANHSEPRQSNPPIFSNAHTFGPRTVNEARLDLTRLDNKIGEPKGGVGVTLADQGIQAGGEGIIQGYPIAGRSRGTLLQRLLGGDQSLLAVPGQQQLRPERLDHAHPWAVPRQNCDLPLNQSNRTVPVSPGFSCQTSSMLRLLRLLFVLTVRSLYSRRDLLLGESGPAATTCRFEEGASAGSVLRF